MNNYKKILLIIILASIFFLTGCLTDKPMIYENDSPNCNKEGLERERSIVYLEHTTTG